MGGKWSTVKWTSQGGSCTSGWTSNRAVNLPVRSAERSVGSTTRSRRPGGILDFWQHRTELMARVPRTRCHEHGVLQTEVPWARPGSGFTLMMEAMVLLLGQQMSVSAAARPTWGERQTTLESA